MRSFAVQELWAVQFLGMVVFYNMVKGGESLFPVMFYRRASKQIWDLDIFRAYDAEEWCCR